MKIENDPIAEFNAIAQRIDAEKRAAEALSNARTRLILGRNAKAVFFATISLKLDLEVCWSIDTAATDGKRIIYNPDFVNEQNRHESVGLFVHEDCHVANKHHVRRGYRDPIKWNVACDGTINPLIIASGFTLPKGAILPGYPCPGLPELWREVIENLKLDADLSAEQLYEMLPDIESGNEQDPGGCGGVIDPGSKQRPDGSFSPGDQASIRQAEVEAEIIIAQAAASAKRRGTLTAGLDRLVNQCLKPKTDVADVLREFVTRHAKNDYLWTPPNRRFISQGLYLPSLRSEELGDIVVLFDTSGSISDKEMHRMGDRLQGILEMYNCRLTILYHDTDVSHVQIWEPGSGPLKLEPKGGGGTSHISAFNWIKEHNLEPVCVIALTDGYTVWGEPPSYPVLWAIVGNPNFKPPFGQVVHLDD